MKAILVTAVLALISATALGAECDYVSRSGDRLAFLDDGENTIRLTEAAGADLLCSWAATPDGPDVQSIACENGTEDGFFWMSAEPSGTTRDILVYDGQPWYTDCGDSVSAPTPQAKSKGMTEQTEPLIDPAPLSVVPPLR